MRVRVIHVKCLIFSLSIVGILWALWLGTDLWAQHQREEFLSVFQKSNVLNIIAVEHGLERIPKVSERFPEDSNEMALILKNNPLIYKFVNRKTHRVWYKDGNIFREQTSLENRSLNLELVHIVENNGQAEFSFNKSPKMAPIYSLMNENWVWFLSWKEGGEDVESFLQQVLGSNSNMRVGLWPTNLGVSWEPPKNISIHPTESLPATSLQGGSVIGLGDTWSIKLPNSAIGPYWEFVFQPRLQQIELWESEIRKTAFRMKFVGILVVIILNLLIMDKSFTDVIQLVSFRDLVKRS